MRAQRHTRKDIELENTLPKRWWWNTNLSMLKAMHYDQYVCILTWEIQSSFFSWSLPFLKSLSLGSKLWWPFRSCLLESYLVILTSRKDLISSCFFVLTFISKVTSSALHFVFLERESWSQPLSCVFGLPPSLIMPPSVQFGFSLRMRLYEGRFGFYKELFSCRIFFWISKLFQTQKSFWHQFKANSFWRNSSDSYVQVFISDEIIFILLLVKMRSDVLLVKNGSRFNPRVSKNQSSKHSFYLHE